MSTAGGDLSPPVPATKSFFLRLSEAKKGTTEVTVQNLLKKNSTVPHKTVTVTQDSEYSVILIEYDKVEDAQQVMEEISGEKLQKKGFKSSVVSSEP